MKLASSHTQQVHIKSQDLNPGLIGMHTVVCVPLYPLLLTKVPLVKAMVSQVVIQECKSWTIKKVEQQRIDSFELWCWEKTLESPLDCKIKPVNPKGDQP